jgi:uncharacterized membrane protein
MTWKNKTLIIGAVGGLMAGLAAAAFFIRSADEKALQGGKALAAPEVETGDLVKVLLAAVGIIRLVAGLGK